MGVATRRTGTCRGPAVTETARMRQNLVSFLVLVVVGCLSSANAAAKIEGSIQGGEVAKGKWKPNFSLLQPFERKLEKALPQSAKKEAKKLSELLDHIQTPGCSWHLTVRQVRCSINNFPPIMCL